MCVHSTIHMYSIFSHIFHTFSFALFHSHSLSLSLFQKFSWWRKSWVLCALQHILETNFIAFLEIIHKLMEAINRQFVTKQKAKKNRMKWSFSERVFLILDDCLHRVQGFFQFANISNRPQFHISITIYTRCMNGAVLKLMNFGQKCLKLWS